MATATVAVVPAIERSQSPNSARPTPLCGRLPLAHHRYRAYREVHACGRLSEPQVDAYKPRKGSPRVITFLPCSHGPSRRLPSLYPGALERRLLPTGLPVRDQAHRGTSPKLVPRGKRGLTRLLCEGCTPAGISLALEAILGTVRAVHRGLTRDTPGREFGIGAVNDAIGLPPRWSFEGCGRGRSHCLSGSETACGRLRRRSVARFRTLRGRVAARRRRR